LIDEPRDIVVWFEALIAGGAGDTVVDVGAGIGSELPTWVELTAPSGQVIAIEAQPTSCRRLATLVELNADDVAVVPEAVADKNGTVTISDRAEEISNTILGQPGGPTVVARTLDEILSAHDVDGVDFLKMNIEGAERIAIAGMGTSIKRVRHAVIVCHDFLADKEGRPELRTKDEVRTFLIDSGFTVRERSDDSRPWVADYLYATASGHDGR